MKLSKAAAGVAFILAALLVSGCASSGGSVRAKAPLVDSVSLVLLTDNDVRVKYGTAYGDNPFMARAGTVTGKPYDFIDTQLSIVTDAGAAVEILDAKVVDKDNKPRAWLYDREEFVKIITDLSNMDDTVSVSKRQTAANWYYLPSRSFTLKHGKYEYMLVFLGKHPVPEDLQVYVRLTVNGQEQEFTLPVPNQTD